MNQLQASSAFYGNSPGSVIVIAVLIFAIWKATPSNGAPVFPRSDDLKHEILNPVTHSSTQTHNLYFYPIAAYFIGELQWVNQEITLQDYSCSSSCGGSWTNSATSLQTDCYNSKFAMDMDCLSVTWTGPFDGCDRTCQENSSPTQYTYFNQQVSAKYWAEGSDSVPKSKVEKFLSAHNINIDPLKLDPAQDLNVSMKITVSCNAEIGMGYSSGGDHNAVVKSYVPSGWSAPNMGQQCSYCQTTEVVGDVVAMKNVKIPFRFTVPDDNKISYYFCKEDEYNFELKVTCPDIEGNCNEIKTIIDHLF